MDAEAALKGCPENSVVIMLVHQPNAAYQILRSVNRKIDLILSGKMSNHFILTFFF